MGRASQRKGRTAERELCTLLNQNGFSVRPGTALNFGTEADLCELEGIHIECKRNEHLNIYGAMEQAEKDAERFADGMPCVFHRKNRKHWLVTMRLENWIDLYRKGDEEK